MLSPKEVGITCLLRENDNPLGAGQMHSYPHDKCSLDEKQCCTDPRGAFLASSCRSSSICRYFMCVVLLIFERSRNFMSNARRNMRDHDSLVVESVKGYARFVFLV